jgi:polyisoprenoid-binding protein YceI
MGHRRRSRFAGLLVCALLIHGAHAQTRPIDPRESSVTVHVSKAGLFSAFGHDHEISGPISGAIDERASTVEITVQTAGLKVLDPDRPEKERAEVQQTMAGPEVLDVQRFPAIHFKSASVEQKSPGRFVVRGDLTLHGSTRPVTVEVTRTNEGRYHATARLKQTEFGMKPVVVAGGTVKVKNEVQLEFTISPERASASLCGTAVPGCVPSVR